MPRTLGLESRCTVGQTQWTSFAVLSVRASVPPVLSRTLANAPSVNAQKMRWMTGDWTFICSETIDDQGPTVRACHEVEQDSDQWHDRHEVFKSSAYAIRPDQVEPHLIFTSAGQTVHVVVAFYSSRAPKGGVTGHTSKSCVALHLDSCSPHDCKPHACKHNWKG